MNQVVAGFLAVIAVVSVVYAYLLMQRADKRARRAVEWIQSHHPDVWEQGSWSWMIRRVTYPQATLKVVLREIKIVEPELKTLVAEVEEFSRQFWKAFLMAVVAITALGFWIKRTGL